MAPPKKDTEQVTLRVPSDVLAEARRIAETSNASAHPWSRNDVLRAAMFYGMASVQRAVDEQRAKNGGG